MAAIRYDVEAVNQPVRVVVQSELVANESLPVLSADPRTAAALESPLVMEENVTSGNCTIMVHRTRASRLRIAAAMRHDVDGPNGTDVDVNGSGDVSRLTVVAELEPGDRLRPVKFLAYVTLNWLTGRDRKWARDR